MVSSTPRIVIDTNIYISALLLKNSIPRHVVDYVFDNGLPLLSDETYEELGTVLLRSKFNKYVSLETRLAFVDTLIDLAEYVEVPPHTLSRGSRDVKDNPFLSLAIHGQASYIITGDTDLLVLNPYDGAITIGTPREFHEAIARGIFGRSL